MRKVNGMSTRRSDLFNSNAPIHGTHSASALPARRLSFTLGGDFTQIGYSQ